MSQKKIMPLDEKDKQLLACVQSDATLSYQALAERVSISPATCLRRLKRLQKQGLISARVALLDADQLHCLEAVVEVTLDRQGAEWQQAFASKIAQEPAVQLAHQVASGPDFILIIAVVDMDGYRELAQKLFTDDANVRHVRTFFSVQRVKFAPCLPL